MMGYWKSYNIYYCGEKVDYEIARSEKEACDLYVEECEEKYIKDYGCDPTMDMIEDVYKNIEAVVI